MTKKLLASAGVFVILILFVLLMFSEVSLSVSLTLYFYRIFSSILLGICDCWCFFFNIGFEGIFRNILGWLRLYNMALEMAQIFYKYASAKGRV